ncbi:MAG: xylulose 5-phosphate 3-epimerase, partial [Planctomycetota bacterium]
VRDLEAAADTLTRAALWTVVHLTYARRVHIDGAPLAAEDFKPDPQGHTGGSLNMVPAFIGYVLANALTGHTRSWLMGQGHCVAAIAACNLALDDLSPEQRQRYGWSAEGLNQMVQDFYSYWPGTDDAPPPPLGSHVSPHTAGGMMEGGFLGYAHLQWPHLPLPGERLVAFLSDGAWEEQRGQDWAPHFWRGEDCGLAVPVLIDNGRRIDQRSQIAMHGDANYFAAHLELNGFDPLVIDGTDPWAFAWAIIESEQRLQERARCCVAGAERYPVRMPYVIATAPKGAGFVNAGRDVAHNLPLGANPSQDAAARSRFNVAAQRLWEPPEQVLEARRRLANHAQQDRPRESQHPLVSRPPVIANLPELVWPEPRAKISPMRQVDETFLAFVEANPGLRPRFGNPDESDSNRMATTIAAIKHRVVDPEPGNHEAVLGQAISCLNEEMAISSVLANTGGLNICVTYEAFATRMHGAVRQDLTWARRCAELGRPLSRLSVPVILTSHTWENGKNEYSHQDPTFVETMLGEMSDTARVRFPIDAATAAACLADCYSTRGQIHAVVVPKKRVPVLLGALAAESAVRDGAVVLREEHAATVELVAIGAYQTTQALDAATRLNEHGIPTRVVAVLEPGRFREARDAAEAAYIHPQAVRSHFFHLGGIVRIFISHTRPQAILGCMRPLDTGPRNTAALGFIGHGGTLDVAGMLAVNRCGSVHAAATAAHLLGRSIDGAIEPQQVAALRGQGDPRLLVAPF